MTIVIVSISVSFGVDSVEVVTFFVQWVRPVTVVVRTSLCKACTTWNRGKGATTVYVDGCVYVFQVWFCDRFIPSNVCVHKYPRFLHWMNINVGDKFIKRAMETGVMLDDYGASRTEHSETCVKASVNSNGEELNKQDKSTDKRY
ncbi:hypothetical protein LR48_Vigan07g074300 [Vigna angularis]|uniref:Uncharacterized protein n=1 Tax=Phaseolus angularis TaxID=3914 RepID=A0A0L9UWY1_PHAAN|nr:hypothetical protein LR48_Vigan07g074300 [Vigna angularis]